MDYYILCKIIGASVGKHKLDIPSIIEANVNWEEIYNEFLAHKIMYLPLSIISSQLISNDQIYNKWRGHLNAAVWTFVNLMSSQKQLINLLHENDIRFVILKGAAAAQYYPEPLLRTMGDIDFMVLERDFYKTYKLMINNGYEQINSIQEHQRHIGLKKSSFIFELHRKPAGLPDGLNGDKVLKYIQSGFDNIKIITVENFSFPVLPPIQNGLVLLLHIVHHLHGGLGYRQIIDWALYVEGEISDDLWNNELCRLYSDFKLKQVALVVTKMCKMYFGLCEEIIWCDEADDLRCQQLFQIISNSGNFGRKQKDKTRVELVEITSRNPIMLLKLLQDGGKRNWKLLKKYPIFTLLAWIYQSGRYVKKIIYRSLFDRKNFKNELTEGKKKKELFDYLEIYNYIDD